jgi:hypothetical protein
MKNIVKKIAIFSLVGIMQVGLGAAVIEASPLHSDGPQRIIQLDDRDHVDPNDPPQSDHHKKHKPKPQPEPQPQDPPQPDQHDTH